MLKDIGNNENAKLYSGIVMPALKLLAKNPILTLALTITALKTVETLICPCKEHKQALIKQCVELVGVAAKTYIDASQDKQELQDRYDKYRGLTLAI